jgi:pimeloyl-ACP methyl ester carboxylesterase
MVFPKTYLQDFGGAGPLVLFLGEILSGCTSWRRHGQALAAQGWRCWGINTVLASYAEQGQRPPQPWSIPRESEALAEAFAQMGIERAHLIGWSLGGSIALDFALGNMERVQSLVLVEPKAGWVLRRSGVAATNPADIEVVRQFADKEITERELAQFMRMAGLVAPGEDPRQSRAWPVAFAHRQALSSAHLVAAHDDDPERLRHLKVPTLLIRGTHSTPGDRAAVEALAKHIPGATVAELPGNHACHLTAFEPFMDVLQDFLERLRE